MQNKRLVVAFLATFAASAAAAQDHRDDGNYRDQNYNDQNGRDQGNGGYNQSNGDQHYRDQNGRNHNVYTGRNQRYQDCRRSNGTTGTIAGAVGGGVIGNVVGGGTLGTLAGAGGGALVGRTLDKNHDRAQNRRNGC